MIAQTSSAWTLTPTHTVTPTTTPSPTFTLTPSPSPSPSGTATETPPLVLFEERFKDELTCFRLHSLDEGIDFSIIKSEYHVSVSKPQTWVDSACDGNYEDFVLEFELHFLKKDDDSYAGVYTNAIFDDSFIFHISVDSYYCITHYDYALEETFYFTGSARNCWVALPDGIDLSQPLNIRVVSALHALAFSINDVLVHVLLDLDTNRGRFGLLVYNHQAPLTEVVFDDIIVRQASPEDLIDILAAQSTGG